MRKAQKHSTNATESQSGNGQTRTSTRAGPRPDGRQPRAANKQGGEGGEVREEEEQRWQLPESIRIVSSSWGIRLASNLFDVSIRVAIFSSLTAPSPFPSLLLLADEICKSNYKNHRAEFSHGNAMGSWLGTPFPTPNQTQRNRPANCQTSNDEMKSNRNSPRSRAGKSWAAAEQSVGWQPTSYACPCLCPCPGACPSPCPCPHPCLTSD